MSDQGSPTRTLRLTPAAGGHPDADDLSTELDAIITIGRALSHIPDADTRARVMRWAIERFGIDVTPASEPAGPPGGDLDLPANVVPAQTPAEFNPEALNLDGISDLFPDPVENTSEAAQAFERSRDNTRVKASAGDRLRDALHWMGI